MPSRKKAKRGGSSRRVPATHPSPNAQVPAAPSRRIRGKRGGLKDMPTLPLDVLVEIVSHMHPKDLLNMSRASRDFRSFLLNRTNAGLWRAARSNVPGLPDCPPFLSEPAYANLVFSFQCHVCSKSVPHLTRLFVEYAARYCKKCEEKMLVNQREDEEVHKFILELKEFIDDGGEDHIELPLLFTHIRLLRSQIADIRARWDANSDDEARRKLLEEEDAKAKQVEKWAKEVYTWARGKKSARRAELSELRHARIDAIMDRLRREGWKEELALPQNRDLKYALEKEKFANKPVALTDKVWEKIRGDANKWMASIRAKRLHELRRNVLFRRFIVFDKFLKDWAKRHWPSDDEQDEPIPLEGIKQNDWLLMPQIQDFLDHFDDKVELTTELLEDAVQDEFFNPVDLAYVWYRDRRADLIDLLERSIGLPELDDEDPLELAIHTFDCATCDAKKFMGFPEVLLHRCDRRKWNRAYPQYSLDYRALAKAWTARSWCPELVRVNTRMFPDKVWFLIRTMGLNPDSATHEAMKKCKTRLTCADCGRGPDGKYEVFDWKRALYHQDSEAHLSSSKPCSWVVLPEEVAESVRKYEAAIKQAGKNDFLRTSSYYNCEVGRCRKSFLLCEREELFAHLAGEHGVSQGEAEDGNHYEREERVHAVSAPPCVYFSYNRSGNLVVSL